MGLKKSAFGRHVLRVLRTAMAWARRGDALKRIDNKRLQASNQGRSDTIYYVERQFSLDETPTFRLKMHLPASMRPSWISCVNPTVDFDDYEDRDFFKRRKDDFLCGGEEEEVFTDDSESGVELDCKDEEEEEIDSKADEFIANFYAEMKLQRQISFFRYNEILERSCGGVCN